MDKETRNKVLGGVAVLLFLVAGYLIYSNLTGGTAAPESDPTVQAAKKIADENAAAPKPPAEPGEQDRMPTPGVNPRAAQTGP